MSTDLDPWLAELVTDRWDLVAPDLLATVSTTPGRYVHHVRAGTAEGRRHFAVKVDTDAGMQSGSRVAVQAWVALRDAELAGRGSVALDLGHPLICVFLTVDLQWHSAEAAAFYAGYRAACPTHLAAPSHDVFTAGLLHAMRYLHFADHLARWERIRWAVAHEQELTALVASPSDFS